jgi:hypothetical protein
MANLTKDRTDDFLANSGREQKSRIAAATKLFAGAIVGYNAGGFLVHADLAAASKPLTVVTQSGRDNDNTGADGATRAWVAQKNGDTIFLITSGAVSLANQGDAIFATDSDTITPTPNTKPLGTLVDYATGVAWIMVI